MVTRLRVDTASKVLRKKGHSTMTEVKEIITLGKETRTDRLKTLILNDQVLYKYKMT